MAMLGRFRRRLAVASLGRLVNGALSGDQGKLAALFPAAAMVRVGKLMVKVGGWWRRRGRGPGGDAGRGAARLQVGHTCLRACQLVPWRRGHLS
jgi:hypothetical protein